VVLGREHATLVRGGAHQAVPASVDRGRLWPAPGIRSSRGRLLLPRPVSHRRGQGVLYVHLAGVGGTGGSRAGDPADLRGSRRAGGVAPRRTTGAEVGLSNEVALSWLGPTVRQARPPAPSATSPGRSAHELAFSTPWPPSGPQLSSNIHEPIRNTSSRGYWCHRRRPRVGGSRDRRRLARRDFRP
jgi:hypothetical protein